MTPNERELLHALKSLTLWAIENESGSPYVASIRKPVAVALVKAQFEKYHIPLPTIEELQK